MAIKPRTNAAIPAKPTEDDQMLKALMRAIRASLHDTNPASNHVTPSHEDDGDEWTTAQGADEDYSIEDPALDDHRTRSRKVYYLTPGALDRMDRIPVRPSACRKVFRYLAKFDAGTVKSMSKDLTLEKKTIGNALAELRKVKLVTSADIPKV